jgi:hypothetical protein
MIFCVGEGRDQRGIDTADGRGYRLPTSRWSAAADYSGAKAKPWPGKFGGPCLDHFMLVRQAAGMAGGTGWSKGIEKFRGSSGRASSHRVVVEECAGFFGNAWARVIDCMLYRALGATPHSKSDRISWL